MSGSGTSELRFRLSIGPIQPRQQSLNIGGLHRRSTPDSQSWRRIAIGSDVEPRAGFFHRGDDRFGVLGLIVSRKLRVSRIGHLEADRRVGARRRVLREKSRPCRMLATHASIAARLARDRASSPLRPPIDSAHFSPSSASSTHSIDGVLMVSPWKMPSINLPPLVI